MIKFCVWDVGNVIYDYSLEPLHQWVAEKTLDRQLFEARKGKFSFNDYMRGNVSYDKVCQDLEEFYSVPHNLKNKLEINKALHQGVGAHYRETRQVMLELDKKGIKNCVLSNALPILATTARVDDIILPERRFTSYELGLLKPEPEIYDAVRERLGCEFKEMMFVDDKPKNVLAAQKLGIRGIVFNANTVVAEIGRVIGRNQPIFNSRGGR